MTSLGRVRAVVRRSGVRGRSTAAAVAVVAVALVVGAAVLLLLLQRTLVTSVADQAQVLHARVGINATDHQAEGPRGGPDEDSPSEHLSQFK